MAATKTWWIAIACACDALGSWALAIYEKPERPQSQSLASPVAASAPNAAQIAGEIWKYQENYDQMRGSRWWSARLRSNNLIHLDFPYEGDSHAVLVIIQNSSGNASDDITRIVLSKGQLVCHSYANPYRLCSAQMRFDDDPILTYTGRSSDPGDVDYLEVLRKDGIGPSFIERAQKATRVTIELDVYAVVYT